MHPINILFVAGYGPITCDDNTSKQLYLNTLGLPLKKMEGNESYMLVDEGSLEGVKHFALWPLSQAADSCFGQNIWPTHLNIPQSWIEFEVENLKLASNEMISKGYELLVNNRLEPWGQAVTRFLSPEGILIGLTVTPWLR
ncbi:hypothetical protein F935_01068 [Acinetobacter calcoaceticus ANC 3811]|uniref:VOC domain-containing protein n=1 Tax=Acinetobacter calcoaceticus ANC 3811 TaxID=1217690 RepID=R8Y5A1_ACICA|nr:glyoxalase/bleomycin resistance/dioxygenase family protein [Acinetobacter calcoaceticus]EOQ64301.1 hypothetical protein F935_01068 [Acinetobacter calcoaceticus ANC 3811]